MLSKGLRNERHGKKATEGAALHVDEDHRAKLGSCSGARICNSVFGWLDDGINTSRHSGQPSCKVSEVGGGGAAEHLDRMGGRLTRGGTYVRKKVQIHS